MSSATECVVECVGDKTKGKNVYCGPASMRLRGRYIAVVNAGQFLQSENKAAGIPDTPGMCVAIDIKNRKVRIYDPLANEQYDSVRAAWAKAGKDSVACKTTKLDIYSDLELAKWSNWFANGVRCGQLELKSGECPKPMDKPKRKAEPEVAPV